MTFLDEYSVKVSHPFSSCRWCRLVPYESDCVAYCTNKVMSHGTESILIGIKSSPAHFIVSCHTCKLFVSKFQLSLFDDCAPCN